jgi:signal transduction histidine kinase
MVALSFILFILLIKFFSTPLEKLSRGVKYIQKGNFNSRLSPINISPEINNLINVINSLLDNINSKIELLEDSNRREMEFISNVAHELKNPITSISMLYEALLTTEKNMTAPQKKILKDIGGRLDHLRNMTSNLLEESHLQKSKDVLQISQFSINKLIKKEIKQLKTLAEEYKTHVIFEPKLKKEIIIESDRERVNSVIRNLLYNAIEFSNSKPVKVELYTREKSVIIKVIDSGPGISEDAKDKIFQRHFTQSMGHSRKYGGSGLGLYISAQNAKMLNGQISLLEPAPKPHGSAFLFTLPLGKK